MAEPWLEAFPRTCKPFLEEMDSILQRPLSEIMAQGPNSTLTMTENAQPAIMATSIMILRVLEQEFGFRTRERISICLGHSMGEFGALIAGGYLSYGDALKLVASRANIMAKCSREASQKHSTSNPSPETPAGGGAGTMALAPGTVSGGRSEYGMVALVCEPSHLTHLLNAIHSFLSHGESEGGRADSAAHSPPIEQVYIGNLNSKNQIVLSGNIGAINTLLVQLRQFGGHDPRAVRLATDSPFHSPIMMPAADLMRRLLAPDTPASHGGVSITFPGAFPCVSNVSARPFASADAIRDLLPRQCTETVRWWDSIRWLDQEVGVRRWVGIGPGKVGRNLVGKEVGMRGRDDVRGGGVWGITEPREVEPALRGLDETEE